MTEEKVIQFPLNTGDLKDAKMYEIDAIFIKALYFDGNVLWVDVYQGTPDGELININTKPVDLAPGSTITIQLGVMPKGD